MTETSNLATAAATAALQVVIELIRAGKLNGGHDGQAAEIIRTHTKLTEHFSSIKKAPIKINVADLA